VINVFHTEISLANGPGRRMVIWVQGCGLHCPGCANEKLWPFVDKQLFSVDALYELVMGKAELIEGVTFSGGEPFLQAKELSLLSMKLKNSGMSIVCFSGFELDFLKGDSAPEGSDNFLKTVDILIDGPFIQGLQGNNLPLRGSSNQNLNFLTDRYNLSDVLSLKREIFMKEGIVMETGFGEKDSGKEILLRALGIIIN
jgi:anaerobic ribonucleoside-triphosphate reductase activating protein